MREGRSLGTRLVKSSGVRQRVKYISVAIWQPRTRKGESSERRVTRTQLPQIRRLQMRLVKVTMDSVAILVSQDIRQ